MSRAAALKGETMSPLGWLGFLYAPYGSKKPFNNSILVLTTVSRGAGMIL